MKVSREGEKMGKRAKSIVMGMLLVLMLGVSISGMQVRAEESKEDASKENCGYQQLIMIDLGETDKPIPVMNYQCDAYAVSDWSLYSTNYFYNQLDANQKTLYDRAYSVCMKYLTSTKDGEAYNSYTGFTEAIIAPTGLSQSDAKEVLMLFMTNNPQFYFINEYWGMGSASNGNYVQIGMYADCVSGSERQTMTQQLSSTIDTWMSQINAQSSVLAKEKMAHDLIVNNVTYEYADYNQSCAGVFLEGKAVCAGYSEAFQLLCKGAGIETISITSEEHEWNIVQIGGTWYNVDCTWDDGDPGCYYNYFNVNDEAISEGYHIVEGIWSGFTVPTCTFSNPSAVYNGVDYSPVYDFDYYCAKNADIKAAYGNDEAGAIRHFVKTGMSEGRRASENFDVQSYRNANVDLRLAYGNDLAKYYQHYIKAGQYENRTTTGVTTIQNPVTTYNGVNYSLVYDFNYYCTKNPDIKKVYGNDDIGALRHFVKTGMSEGRMASASFDVQSYRNANVDLRLAYGNDLAKYYQHYMRSGKNEGRKTTGVTTIQNPVTSYGGVNYSAVYDFNYYCSKYPDIKKAYGNDDIAALRHFVKAGMSEGRQASANFDVYSYKNANVDLRLAYGNNLVKYYQHYCRSGKNEGRKTTGVTTVQNPISSYNGVNYSSVYNYNYYCAKNPDVKAAYGNDDIAVLNHFIRSGMSEGRQASEDFNVQIYKDRYSDVRAAYGNNLKEYYLHYIRSGKSEGRSAK